MPSKAHQNVLVHALFVINFLQLDQSGHSAVDRLCHRTTTQQYASVLLRDPLTNKWNRPDPVLIWGRGSACIFDTRENFDRWLPPRLIKYVNPSDSPEESKNPETSES